MLWRWGKTQFLCKGNQHHICFLVLHKVGEQLKDSARFWCRFPHHLFVYLWHMMAWSHALGTPCCKGVMDVPEGPAKHERWCGVSQGLWRTLLSLLHRYGQDTLTWKVFWSAWQQSDRAGEVLPLFPEFRAFPLSGGCIREQKQFNSHCNSFSY